MTRLQHNREAVESSNGDQPGDSAAVLAAARKQTRKLARSHYENFLVASLLLPRPMRQPFYDLYAFCRTADDLADESDGPQAALEHLRGFQDRLDATFRGQPSDDLFVALSDTIDRFSLPKQPFDDLLDAFRQDQRKTRYSDFDELRDYCRRSANPVGHLVLHLGGCFSEQNALLSDEVCTGLQLANLWQDVARDRVIGRIYVPAEEMQRYEVTETMFDQTSTPQPLRKLLANECGRAEGFLRRGLPLAERVPRWLANDVKLFVHGGLATLRAIERIDYDVLRVRPTVSRWRQAGLLARAALRML